MKTIKRGVLLMSFCTLFIGVMAKDADVLDLDSTTQSITLTGQIANNGAPLDSGLVFLQFQSDNRIDSSKIINGRFVIKDKMREAGVAWLTFSGAPRKGKALFLAPGQVSYLGDLSNPTEGRIKGSQFQVAFEQWNKAWNLIHLEAGKYYQALNEGTQGGKIEAPDSIRRYVDQGFLNLGRKTDSSVLAIVHQYPSSPVSAYVVVNRYVNYPNEVMLDSCMQLLDKKAMLSSFGRIITKHHDDYLKTAIGATPKLTLPDSTGKMVSLADYKGKYLFVDFWASWCSPCRKENPNVVKAFKAFHKDGLEILGVSLDENKKSWLAAVKKDDLNWGQVSDLKGWKSGPVQAFGIKSIPFNFLIDRSGKIVARNLRGAELEKKLQELITSSE